MNEAEILKTFRVQLHGMCLCDMAILHKEAKGQKLTISCGRCATVWMSVMEWANEKSGPPATSSTPAQPERK